MTGLVSFPQHSLSLEWNTDNFAKSESQIRPLGVALYKFIFLDFVLFDFSSIENKNEQEEFRNRRKEWNRKRVSQVRFNEVNRICKPQIDWLSSMFVRVRVMKYSWSVNTDNTWVFEFFFHQCPLISYDNFNLESEK